SHSHAGTFSDGFVVSRARKVNVELARLLLDYIFLEIEDDIRQSMVALIQRNKVINEGAGAISCAALLSGKLEIYIKNRKTV
ncbi:threonine ammonia-lyase, partial [Klebsiella pneumoniae]|nr:threonine ammonia-lyase [Klebsiella pneumoniae]